VAKAALWAVPDAKTRQRGEQTGLETPVVHAVNDVHWAWRCHNRRAVANAISAPPGDYERKLKTQRN
jgi:hypothetical protein